MNAKTLSVLKKIAIALLLIAVFANMIYIAVGITGRTLGTLDFINAIILSLTLIFAAYYLISGCTKDLSASFFKCFMNVFALEQLICLAGHSSYDSVSVILIALTFGALTVLSVAKDLGEKLSKKLGWVVVFCTVCRFIPAAVTGQIASGWIGIASIIFLALCCQLMVCAKYQDKKERGRA